MATTQQPGYFNAQRLEFSHTAFNLLMQKRVYRVLIVCSNYDYFMLEEDGRIDEQIFNEYTALNFRFPPVFIQANSAKQAFEVLEANTIDLVILMLNIGDIEPFELANRIRKKYAETAIVVLTNFSREVSLRLQNEDLSSIDYVFCWLGNADILVAIIKLIEDSLNAEHDMLQIGVQCIVLVEDSVRYISQMLPNLYKTIIHQSHYFAHEGLNEHQKMLRLRGRPKILLAKTFDEALSLYQKYKDHILGIVSDISFKKNNRQIVETPEGIVLCKWVRNEQPFLPFLLQSSDIANKQHARALNVGFLHKLSKTLSHDLYEYLIANFGFGDLIFSDPDTGSEVFRIHDLVELQHLVLHIPDNIFTYHANRNELSKWLNARGLFGIGKLFRTLTVRDFENVHQVRSYVYDAIASYRLSHGRGVIAEFEAHSFDEFTTFSRIGNGSLGGKARGLAFVDTIINKHGLRNKFGSVQITIPRTVVIATDMFDAFIADNNLFNIGQTDLTDQEIVDRFVQLPIPILLTEALRTFVTGMHNAVAIRSSSKLEDSHYQPFAGVYSTYMLPLVPNDPEASLSIIANAIKCVYASVYFKASKDYMAATSNIIDEEKMGIVLQEVCGKAYGNRYYPVLSGVARSINHYPIKPELPEDGVAHIALGLGKYIVDGGLGIRFCPKYPQKIVQLSSPETMLHETQKYIYALDLQPDKWIPLANDKSNLLQLRLHDIARDKAFKTVASTYDYANQTITDAPNSEGASVITFSKVLNHNIFPLAAILKELLEIGQKEMNVPIEIEFAAEFEVTPATPATFYVLQIRPMAEKNEPVSIDTNNHADAKLLAYSDKTLGNGEYKNIKDIVYVKCKSLNAADSIALASEIALLNKTFREKHQHYILAGPGRWGSADAWLGVPVKWTDISEARIIIELGYDKYHIDPSQGTHFFQNLTAFNVGYLTINEYLNEGTCNETFLYSCTATYESKLLRRVTFNNALDIRIDGKNSRGSIKYL